MTARVLTYLPFGRSGKYILDDAGQPVPCEDVLEWAEWIESTKSRHLGDDTIGEVRVSTIFLGIDHAFGMGPPILWETMIFGGEHDGWMDRYATRGGALAGHLLAVARVKGKE